jgi:dTDP-4-amino-4,6-dideoxygalactose transaminase
MGEPRRPREVPLPFAYPDLDGSELREIEQVLQSGWLTTGQKVVRFEEEFRQVVGASHALAVNSCTAALHLALEAAGVASGDEVITSPYTFAATAEVILYLGACPVFVDVDPVSLNIDPAGVEAAITERTRALVPVHFAGHPTDLDPLYELSRKYGLAMVEDAAHALPARYKGRMIGADSGLDRHLVCFSFYPTKTMTTGEGGMVCTGNAELAERCRLMSLHGISKDAWKRYTTEGSWSYDILAPGYKYNLTDVAAAIGLAQLPRLHAMRDSRAAIARRYDQAFGDCAALETPRADPLCHHSWHLYPLRLRAERLSIDRAAFIEELRMRNICASVHFAPLHLHSFYRERYGYRADDFPVAHREYQREVSLPIYSAMSADDVEDVVSAVLQIVGERTRV